eukprot:Skav215997  [mRNA]  locus=scaffold4632:18610:19442:- [translate_table: standard]
MVYETSGFSCGAHCSVEKKLLISVQTSCGHKLIALVASPRTTGNPHLRYARRQRRRWQTVHERFDRYFKCLAITGKDLDGDPVVVERCGKVHAPSMAKCSEDFLRRHAPGQ